MSKSSEWVEYVRAFNAYIAARMALHGGGDELVEAMRRGLFHPEETAAALQFMPYLPGEQALQLVEELITVGLGVDGLTKQVWERLCALPRAKIVAAVAKREEGIIMGCDSEAAACLLQLWVELGERERAVALAKRALDSTDEDVRDSAAAFLEK